MNKKERNILKMEQDFRDTLENKLEEKQDVNKRLRLLFSLDYQAPFHSI